MADIKTTLRELSVIYGLLKHFNGGTDENFSDFLEVTEVVLGESFAYSLIVKDPKELVAHRSIVENGLKVSEAIIEAFDIRKTPVTRWVGEETQSGTPVDIFVNNIPISLKEDSFILENMGLYRMMNILTGSEYSRGELHIFKKFAPKEYKNWFDVTWSLLITQLEKKPKIRIPNKKKHYLSEITLSNKVVTLSYRNKDKSIEVELPTDIDIVGFEKITNSIIREKVFSKWINNFASVDKYYLTAKKLCAVTAGNKLEEAIGEKGNNLINFSRLFRLLDEKYYLIKVSRNKVKIFEVPSKKDFEQDFELVNFEASVPKSQLNFHIKIVNKKTGKDIDFRNEIRFSHGQFNGTPEAKLYAQRHSLLSVIYKKIYGS